MIFGNDGIWWDFAGQNYAYSNPVKVIASEPAILNVALPGYALP